MVSHDELRALRALGVKSAGFDDDGKVCNVEFFPATGADSDPFTDEAREAATEPPPAADSPYMRIIKRGSIA